ncbi:MAG: ATP-binding cassette domain-containing protein [Xanthomonadales bacterium]|nr:ATP-binding cassette domain-containing protein [Xanthomonadales bacterium]
MTTTLALNDVSGEYGGVRVLGPLSLAVADGERVALVGKSGAGKSTLLSLMFENWRPRVAYMPQALGLVDTLSVFHNVFMGRLDRHPAWYNLVTLLAPFRRDVEDVERLLARLAMEGTRRQRAGELSGGQRQRVAVARVLFQDTDVLLADEPVSALDGPLAEVVLQALTDSYRTAVLAMHDVELALRFTDRVVGIRDGHIALDEPSKRLSANDLLPLY